MVHFTDATCYVTRLQCDFRLNINHVFMQTMWLIFHKRKLAEPAPAPVHAIPISLKAILCRFLACRALLHVAVKYPLQEKLCVKSIIIKRNRFIFLIQGMSLLRWICSISSILKMIYHWDSPWLFVSNIICFRWLVHCSQEMIELTMSVL